jgi:TPR repeat protein
MLASVKFPLLPSIKRLRTIVQTFMNLGDGNNMKDTPRQQTRNRIFQLVFQCLVNPHSTGDKKLFYKNAKEHEDKKYIFFTLHEIFDAIELLRTTESKFITIDRLEDEKKTQHNLDLTEENPRYQYIFKGKDHCSPEDLLVASSCLLSLLEKGVRMTDEVYELFLASLALAVKTSADSGNADAQFQLAHLLYRGIGFKKNIEKSAVIYKELAQKGHPYAQLHYGVMCTKGEGVKQDAAVALRVLEVAAVNKMLQANNFIGEIYSKGIFPVHKNYEKALYYFKKAAADGDPFGFHNLGIHYREGKGTLKDMQKALNYFEKAANMGNPPSMACAADIYETQCNYKKANEWIDRLEKLVKTNNKPSKESIHKII